MPGDLERLPVLVSTAADDLFPACQRRGVAVLAADVFNSGIAVTAAVVGARNAMEITQNVSYLAAAVPPELFGDLAAERLIPDGG